MEAPVAKKKATVKFESESDDDDGGIFVNPLLVKGTKTDKTEEESEGFSSADEEDEKMLKKETSKKKDKVIGKRKKRTAEEEDDVGDFFANTEIEVVPQQPIRERTKTADSDNESGYSSMDSDEMAETRALAKLMLRKKTRTEILDSTYNRFATHEDKS